MTATMVVPLKLTREQFGSLPEPEHGGKMELVDGRLVIMAPVGPEHGDFASYLIARLVPFVGEHGLGVVRSETGYWLAPDLMRAPDISFVTAAGRGVERVIEGYIDRVPDLAIEVVSPGHTETEIAAKVRSYLAHGVARVWIVRPGERSVAVHDSERVHVLGEGEFLTSDDAGFEREGFVLQVRRVFEF